METSDIENVNGTIQQRLNIITVTIFHITYRAIGMMLKIYDL